MVEETDCVIIKIQTLLAQLPCFTPSKPIIARVDHHLRQVDEKDFEPQIVSVGPIHHGKDCVMGMELHKARYLQQLLGRRDDISIEKFVLKIRDMEEKARLYYPSSINLDQDEFVEMMLLDGCFVIELLRSYWFDDLREKNDQIFQFDYMLSQIRHDLMLLENQLPFFVLNELFDMTKMGDPEDDIFCLFVFFVGDMFPWSDVSMLDSRSHTIHSADHLLGLVHQSCFSFSPKYFTVSKGHKENNLTMHTFSASEMKRSGVRLKASKGINLWEVSFVDGVVKLPPLNISDETEPLFKNLIAYELCFPHDRPKYVTDYAFFMHCLIKSAKDVEILRRSGIVSNFIGSDDMICLMFNRLGKNVAISSDFCYSNVFESLERYNRVRRRVWMAKVKRKCLKSPWAMISILGAAVLLILTFVQTLVLVLSYRKWSLLSTK